MGLDLDALSQQTQQLLRGAAVQLQADDGLVGPFFQHLGHHGPEIPVAVLKFFPVEAQVGVAGGADDAKLLHRVFFEKGRRPVAQDRLQPQEAPAAFRQREDRRQGRRAGDKAQRRLAALAPQQGRDIQRLVVQTRAGVALPHDLGGEHGQDDGPEIVVHLGLLLRSQVVVAQVLHPGLGQQRADPAV